MKDKPYDPLQYIWELLKLQQEQANKGKHKSLAQLATERRQREQAHYKAQAKIAVNALIQQALK